MEQGTRVTRTGIRLIVGAVLGFAMTLGAGAQGSSAPPVTLPDGSKSQEGAKKQDGSGRPHSEETACRVRRESAPA